MRYRAVLFDLDGVLCSTDRYHYEAWKQIADSIDTEFTEKDNDRLRGVSRMESLEILLEKCPHVLEPLKKEQLAEEKNRIYRELLQGLTDESAADGARELLAELKSENIRAAVASSSKNAPFILERIGLADAFDTVVDGTMIVRSKPDPEVFLLAARQLELDPADCLVIEDARAGVDAAKAGGFSCGAMGEAASYDKADYVFKSLWDVADFIKQEGRNEKEEL